MSGGMWAGIAQAAGGVMGLLDNHWNRKAQEEANKQNIENAWAMWNANNAYNTPAEQVKRYKEANLNTALLYGGGAGSAGNASMASMPDIEAVKTNAGQTVGNAIASGIGTYQDWERTSAEVDSLKNQIEVQDSQELVNNTNALKNLADTDKTKLDTDLARDTYQMSIDAANERARQIKLQNDAQTNENEAFNPRLQAELASKRASTGKTLAENAMIKKELDSYDSKRKYQIMESLSRIDAAIATQSTARVERALKREQVRMAKMGLTLSPALMQKVVPIAREKTQQRARDLDKFNREGRFSKNRK